MERDTVEFVRVMLLLLAPEMFVHADAPGYKADERLHGRHVEEE
jgi:hypothetical protein